MAMVASLSLSLSLSLKSESKNMEAQAQHQINVAQRRATFVIVPDTQLSSQLSVFFSLFLILES
jgi:hypothetical protein